jgi:L,D-transpeptidase catalytic domain
MLRWVSVLTLTSAGLALGCRNELEKREAPKDVPLSQLTPVVESVEAAPEPGEYTGPIVGLDGVTHPHAVTLIDGGQARVYSRSLRTRIHRDPSPDSPELGYLRVGGSAPARGAAQPGPGCPGGWVPVSPSGFVCLGKRATLDRNDPVVRMSIEHPPDFSRKLPYIYGTVRNPGPEYARLPTHDELRKVEPDIDARMPRWLGAEGEVGAGYAQEVWLGGSGTAPEPGQVWTDKVTQGVPRFLSELGVLSSLEGASRERDQVELGVMRAKMGYAMLETFLWEGRRYGLTPEAEVLPTDRLRPIRGSDFHGVRIGVEVQFPFAFVRTPNARYRDGAKASYRAVVQLTGKQQFFEGTLHYETADGRWLSDRAASRLDPAKKIPGWGLNGEKWIDVNLTKQTLVLYEGSDPVYATLISSGEAGLEDAETTTATKRGIFRIHTKHVSATMSSREIGEEFELRDVPYVMYFEKGGYALHGAYWHDRFGMPKSHGCINLAPEDARRIFHWTLPVLPTGWHGVLSPLKGTVVFVHQ